MTVAAFAWAWRQSLPCQHKMVLLALADTLDQTTGESTPSHDAIGETSGLSYQQIDASLAALQGFGLISILKPRRRYALHLPIAPAREHDQSEPDGCVYVMTTLDKVKVGISRDARVREKSIQNGVPAPVTLVEVFPMKMRQARLIEQACLAQFDDQRLNGEWLAAPVDDVLKTIRTLVAEAMYREAAQL